MNVFDNFIHGFDKHSEAVGLGKSNVDTGGGSEMVSHLIAEHRKQYNSGFGKLGLQDRGDFDSVQSGHDHVKDQQVGPQPAGGFERGEAIFGFGANEKVFLLFKIAAYHRTNNFVVVCEKDTDRHVLRMGN